MITPELEQELSRFVTFGHILDKRTRAYLAQYIRHQIAPNERSPPEALEDAYQQYFTQAIDAVFGKKKLLPKMRERAQLASQVVIDTLRWMRVSFRESTAENPYEEEQDRLNQWAATPWARWKAHWHVPVNYLSSTYSSHEIDTGFYVQKFKQLISPDGTEIHSGSKDEGELIIKDLLAQWDSKLQAKLIALFLMRMEEKQAEFEGLMEAKATEYLQLESLIQPFGEFAGRYWDLSRSLWKETSFSVLTEYADLLSREEEIAELADMLGRMRQAQIELEEETYEEVISRQQWLTDTQARSEIDGIHTSQDLNAVLSSEISLLADPDTETVFLQKYADQQLLTWRYKNQELVTDEHRFTTSEQKVKQKEKGPFIVCVDTSDSMRDRPEHIAKVLCFAILRMAAQDNRRAYLINFSTGIQTLDLYNIADSIDAIAAFLRMSFHGGTDISPALYEVLRQLQQEGYEDADVLVISDFIMYRVEEDILTGVQHFQQNKGTQFHSLTLAKDPIEALVPIFDTSWVYDPKGKGIYRAMADQLQRIGTRIPTH